MRTVVLDPPPVEVERMIERRRRLGLDMHDEIWEGEYHVVPGPAGPHSELDQQLAVLFDAPARAAGLTASGPFNVGVVDNFRVPDRGLHRSRPAGVWNETAAVVIEIVSPGDETWQKLGFYAAHHVDEVVIVDPSERSVDWLVLAGARYEPAETSGLVPFGPGELAARIDWPDPPSA
jgi:Uma2 family endonuclease